MNVPGLVLLPILIMIWWELRQIRKELIKQSDRERLLALSISTRVLKKSP